MEAKNNETSLVSEITQRNTSGDSCLDDSNAWLFLIRDRRWSLAQKRMLIDHFGDPQTLYKQSRDQISMLVKGRFRRSAHQVSEAAQKKDQEWLSFEENHLITFNDKRYPSALKEISDPPIALFATGDLACLNDPIIAMVGSRRPSPVGAKLCSDLASQLANLGVSIASGMALGIDAMAHQACIGAGGQTIAVMACGLDIVYPARHRQLFSDVIVNGCALSEYPLGLAPTKYSFPQRNRIVSGLSLGVIIVEAAERSGTLITARLASEQDRQVMVVPGSALSAQYKGSHRLLRQGAAVVCGVDDVLFELSSALADTIKPPCTQKPTETKAPALDLHPLLHHLSDQSSSVDQVVRRSGLPAAEVSSMLLMLEVDGLIAITNEGGYVRLV